MARETRPEVATETDKSVESEVRDLVELMDLNALIGQTFILGYWEKQDAAASNRGLVELVQKYRPGGVILFKHNIPRTGIGTDGSIGWFNDLEVARATVDLTRTLQAAAAETSPPLPLLIALDQEGGGASHLKKGVTRIPYAIQLGASRSAKLAFAAGEVIGDELSDLGINTNLAPVADVNNNNENDIIGRRAYGAHPDIVSPLAVAFATGLREQGVLSIGKHFPGHGSSREDPHYVLPVMGHDDSAQFEGTDLAPFRALIASSIDGLLTAHILVPFLDANEPVTFSRAVVEDLLRKELGFQGLIITDDLSAMRGALKDPQDPQGPNRWNHTDIVPKAYDAGNDMLIFGYILQEERGSQEVRESTVTREDFDEIFHAALDYFDGPKLDASRRQHRRNRLEESVVRILSAKARILASPGKLTDADHWRQPFDEATYAKKLAAHERVSEDIARSSSVLISEEGRIINSLDESRYFRTNVGPLTQDLVLKSANDTVTVVSPVFREDELTEEIASRWINPARLKSVQMVYGFYDETALQEAERIWGQKVRRLSVLDENGTRMFADNAIVEKAQEIIEAGRDSRIIVFGVLTDGQIRVLQQVCRHFKDDASKLIVVLLLREPYFVPKYLYEQGNTIFLFVPALPTMRVAVDILYGDLQPHPVSYLPVSVPGKVNRNIAPGVKVEPLIEPVEEPHVEPSPSFRDQLGDWIGAIGGWTLLAGILGGLCFWTWPRGHLRWSEKAESQWNVVDLLCCLGVGVPIAWLLAGLLPQVGSIEISAVTIPQPGALPISALAFVLTIVVEWQWLSRIRSRGVSSAAPPATPG